MQFRKYLTQQLGFTMVELLVVISIIGILATAVLAALNPVEQLRKGRDTSRKADAQTVLGAIDRFQATFGCYPWQWNATTNTCTATVPATLAINGSGNGVAVNAAAFNTGGVLYQITQKDELKAQFSTRRTIQNAELWLSVDARNQASVCFEPESQSARGGGLGPIRNAKNALTTPTAACTGNYSGTAISQTTTCAVCVPQ